MAAFSVRTASRPTARFLFPGITRGTECWKRRFRRTLEWSYMDCRPSSVISGCCWVRSGDESGSRVKFPCVNVPAEWATSPGVGAPYGQPGAPVGLEMVPRGWWQQRIVITALRCGVILPEFALRQPNQIGVRQRTPAELTELSERAEYVGSPEHKLERWWGGLPMGRQLPGGRVGRPGKETTTICRLTRKADRAMATEWVRAAILLGQCRFYESDRDFPKKVWYEADGQIWMGLLVNAGPGEYKGWPICERYRNAVFGRMD